MPRSDSFRRRRRPVVVVSRSLTALWALAWCLSCAAQVTLNAVPGGVVEIPLASLNRPRPQAFFGQERILVMAFGRRWVGLVGLPLTLVPGNYLVQARLEDDQDAVGRRFTVYPRQVDQPPVVETPYLPPEPSRPVLTWREPLDAKLPLDPPVPLPARPVFGHYRKTVESQSGLRSAYVNFIVFPVSSDTAVKAPGDGLVSNIEPHENGAYVWIDHGMGLFSRVGPVTRTGVHKSQPVKTAQMIGRITHDPADKPRSLYWWVFLNGTAVNPFLMSHIDKTPITTGDSGSSPRQ